MVFACAVGMVCITVPSCAAVVKTEKIIKETSVIEKIGDAEINWSHGMITAKGEAAMASSSKEPNRARAYLKAKTYARMLAVAHLLAAIEGTRIDYEATGKDAMDVDETVRQKIEGFVQGVEITDESRKSFEGDTIVTVVVGTRMYGKSRPGTMLLQAESQRDVDSDTEQPSVDPTKTVEPVLQRSEVETFPAVQQGPFTSIIIDTRGLKVCPAMSPKIRRMDGSEVWGTVSVSPEFAVETGIVAYERSIDSAKHNARCGANPLIIRAVSRAGIGASKCDPVISDEDAARLLSENANTKFCDKFNVIFVVDPVN